MVCDVSKCRECISELLTVIDHLVNVEKEVEYRDRRVFGTLGCALNSVEVAEESGCLPRGTSNVVAKKLSRVERLIEEGSWDDAWYVLNEEVMSYFRDEYRAPIAFVANLCCVG